MYAALAETLRVAGIEYISTHTLFSADDPSNFVPDGHYTESANRRLVESLHTLIRQPKAVTGEAPIEPAVPGVAR